MRNLPEYECSKFFVLRTPLLPLDELSAWSDFAADPPKSEGDAFSSIRQVLRLRLKSLLLRPEITEALFLASPELLRRVPKWLDDPDSDNGRRIERSLVCYLLRMTARSTPFGMFAGISVGTMGADTKLQLKGRHAYRRHVRLDAGCLTKLAARLVGDQDVRPHVRFYPNSSLYAVGDVVRYYEARVRDDLRTYFLVEVRCDENLRRILDLSAHGTTLGELAASLVDAELPFTETMKYVEALVAAGVLQSEIAPGITGRDPMDGILAALRGKPCAVSVRRQMVAAKVKMKRLRRCASTSPAMYRELAKELSGLVSESDVSRVFQVDMTKDSVEMTIAQDVVDAFVDGAVVLQRLFGVRTDGRFEQMRARFQERYGERRVHLTEVLDRDMGIGLEGQEGYGGDTSPLLEGLPLRRPPSHSGDPVAGCTTLLTSKLAEALMGHREEVVLTDAEMDTFRNRTLPFPDAFQVVGTVLGDMGVRSISRPVAQVFVASGPSGATYLGRFCHTSGQLRKEVLKHLRAEEALAPGVVYCEIVHAPQGRQGNVLARPVLRQYELPFLGHSGAPRDRQLGIDDLTVFIAGNQIVLWSESLEREVVPRLTSAHNFHNRTIPLYRFLGLLQSQGRTPAMQWNWGTLAAAPFLPRVRYRRTIISPRTWQLTQEQIEGLGRSTSESVRLHAVEELRKALGIPRYVLLSQVGHALLIDLENVLCLDALVHATRTERRAILQETLQAPRVGQLAVSGPEGGYCHEMVIPFVMKKAAASEQTGIHRALSVRNIPVTASRIARNHTILPGAEWLYAKIFCGAATADQVLVQAIKPTVDALVKSGVVNRYFFVRYNTPMLHLRVRMRGAPERLFGEAAPQLRSLLDPFIVDGRVWRLEYDTYVRELASYGGPGGIELCEGMFEVDSDAAIALLPSMLADEGLRWRLVLKGTDHLFQAFGLTLIERYDLVSTLASAFRKEFRIEGQLKRSVQERFRQERVQIALLLQESMDGILPVAVADVLREQSLRLGPYAEELLKRIATGEVQASLEGVLERLVHMHANRIFRSAPRPQEGVVYNLLSSHYRSTLAQMK